jgi:hypothetical protein
MHVFFKKNHKKYFYKTRVKQYFSRIKEIEEAQTLKNTNKIDKESSARIIKRSLWMNAQQGGKTKATSVSDLVNKTLETGVEKHKLEEESQVSNKKMKF